MNSIRTSNPKTIQRYTSILTAVLTESINSLGLQEPTEEYFKALEKYLSASFAPSTAKEKLRLTRSFFTWVQEEQKGDKQLPLITEEYTNEELLSDSNVKATAFYSRTEDDEILHGTIEQEPIPPLTVEASNAIPPEENPSLPPQEKGAGDKEHKHTGRPRKSAQKRDKKFSIYLTQSLFDDVADLARIQRLSTPDFIFSLLEKEIERRADKLAAFRALEDN